MLKVLCFVQNYFVSPNLHFSPGRLVGELVGLLTGDRGDKSRHTHLKVHLWYAWTKTNICEKGRVEENPNLTPSLQFRCTAYGATQGLQ